MSSWPRVDGEILEYLGRPRNGVFGFGPAVADVLGMLAEADRVLARRAIDDAIAAGGKSAPIVEAKSYLAQGEAAQAQGSEAIGRVAINMYRQAWDKATKSYCNR